MSNDEEGIDWSEWIDDLVDAIRDGSLDPHLRTIVRTAYERRSPDSVIPDKVAAKLQKSANPLSPVPAKVLPTPGEAPTNLTYAMPFVIESGSIRSRPGGSNPTCFQFEGSHHWFPKDQFVGRAFRISPASIKQRGVTWSTSIPLLLIVEINPKRVMVRFLNKPSRSTPKVADAINRGVLFAMDREILRRLTTTEREDS